MDGFDRAVALLPERLRQPAAAYRGAGAEEIRLRAGRPPTLLLEGRERPFAEGPVTVPELHRLLELATGASFHTAAPALAEGFFSCGGLRIGVCGTAARSGGETLGFRALSSAAIRIPAERRGVCDALLEKLYREGFENTLIVSPPGGGKTTALREMIRRLSGGGTRLGVLDERNELSATEGGRAQFDLGACSDVLVGVPKAEGAMMLLRGMNPQILAMDEISSEADAEAAERVCGCGAGLLATAHASGRRELRQRPVYRRLLERGIFRVLITISGVGDKRRYTAERLNVCE